MHLKLMPLPRSARAATLAGHGLPSHDSTSSTSPGGGLMPLSALAGRQVIIEEQLDGADAELAFAAHGSPLLRSQGRPLAGGFGERPFIPLRIWAMAHEQRLIERLGDRHELRGTWTYATRRVWYDQLPHYFNEADVLDRATGLYLSTPRRQALLAGSPVLSAPVLYAGPMPTHPQLLASLIARPLAKSADWRLAFETTARRESLPVDLGWRRTDRSGRSAGLIVKVEDDEHVLARFTLVRPAPSHETWERRETRETPEMLDGDEAVAMRPLLPNGLAAGADLFAARPTVTWHDLGLKTLRSLGALKTLSIETREQRCC
ncbi:hypothetical protein CDN99_21780 [Roseateles aquatilis]|uniref:RNA ligase domain-containing protein n=1 Tax=Roseateles aquatilis TaxID=431061 RepID=A0A246IZC7_9BURK|nr:RNA ligase family protein [Roseateles aquatilis]OWQ85710.1 hypothetical protein CDN99_21780 [Roseateles aquatilis]